MARKTGDELLDAISDSGELRKQKKSQTEIEEKEEVQDSYIFELIGDFPIVDKVKRFPPVVTLPYSDMVYDENKGTYRNVRYLVGLDTIYEDEQEGMDEKAVKRLIPQRLQFDKGRMVVDGRNTTLVEFMMKSNFNINSKNRKPGIMPLFRLVDDRAIEKAKLAFVRLSRKAASLADDATDREMMDHASYVGIILTDNNGKTKSIDGIRAEYIKYAADNPENFLKSHNNPMTTSFVRVRRAIESDLISLTHVKGQAFWSEGPAFILDIPEGKNPYEILAKHALSESGKDFKERLYALTERS